MARKADIQYIRHAYNDGTAAKKVVFTPGPKKAPLPLFEPEMMEPDRKIRIAVDPLSVAAIVVAVALVVMMVVSLLQFGAAHRQQVSLQGYVYDLRNENVRLDQEYRNGFDLEKVEAQALALGMVPAEQLQTMTIGGQVPEVPAAPTMWEQIVLVFSELFAGAKV